MSQPWMKFYPSDWRADPALRMCSMGARGLWLEMIALMHEAEPYGHLLVNGRPVNEKQLASLAGGTLRETVNYLAELETCGVLSKTTEGIIFSRRMVRDKAKAERDKENGCMGGNPRLNAEDKAGVNPPDKAQKPEARNQKEDSGEFEEFWKSYPRRKGSNPKPPALKAFKNAVKSGVDPPQLIAAARKYAAAEEKNTDTEFIPMAASWLNKRYFEQYMPDPGEAERWLATVDDMKKRGYEWVDGKWQKPGEAA